MIIGKNTSILMIFRVFGQFRPLLKTNMGVNTLKIYSKRSYVIAEHLYKMSALWVKNYGKYNISLLCGSDNFELIYVIGSRQG